MQDSIVLKHINSPEEIKLTMNFKDFDAKVIDFVEVQRNELATAVDIQLELTSRNRRLKANNVRVTFSIVFEWEILSWRPFEYYVDNFGDCYHFDTLYEFLEDNTSDVNCILAV